MPKRKRIKYPKRRTPVVVVWVDAAAADEDGPDKLPIAYRAGWFWEEKDDYIVIAGEWFEDNSWRDGIIIPKILVKKVSW